jgi:MFS transporter, ACS family, hexuronate transporter
VRWVVLALLLAVTSINYLDRLLLSVLAPVIRDQFHFNPSLYGNINAVFQLCYAFGFLASGALIDRYGVKRGLAVGATLWSVASAMHASVTGAAQFGVWRGILGLTESINFPACNKAVAEWFPIRQRALATGIFNAGPNLASVIGPPVFIAVTASFGWRVCFAAVSLLGFLWLILWVTLYRPSRDASTKPASRGFGLRSALRFRQTRGYALSKALVDPMWYFLLFWLPLYFRDVLGLDMAQIGWALPCVYFASGAGSVAAGWISGFLLARGWSLRAARMTTLTACAVLLPIALFSAMGGTLTRTIAMFSLAAAAHQAFSSISFTIPGDVLPIGTLGSTLGFGSFAGTISSVAFSAILPGYLIPLLGYKPLILVMSFGYLAAVGVLNLYFGEFRHVEEGNAAAL